MYGVGMMGLHGGPEYSQIVKDVSHPQLSLSSCDVSQILPSMIAVINAPDSRSPTNVDATENTISALLKICRSVREQRVFMWLLIMCSNPVHGFPAEQYVPLLMEWLPVTEDDEEAEYIYEFICELIETFDIDANVMISKSYPSHCSNSPIVMADQYIPKLVHIFAAVLNTTLLPASLDISKRLANALRVIQPRVPAELWLQLTQVRVLSTVEVIYHTRVPGATRAPVGCTDRRTLSGPHDACIGDLRRETIWKGVLKKII